MNQRMWAVWLVLGTCLTASASRPFKNAPHGDADLHCLKNHCEKNPTVRALAKDIDKVEWLINRDGTIVAKTPAIWGEARLAKHRREYEEQMGAQLTAFTDTMQGFVARSDQAYLSEALSLSNAATGGTVNNPAQSLIPPIVTTTATSATTPGAAQSSVFATAPFAPFGTATATGLSFVRPDAKLSLEPVISLDQRSRYLQHLHELRRINEGDDTADAPGYSLNLVRIPVSLLPGKHTRKGHGAEITFTIKANVGPELLPRTFRNLVNNDVKDLLAITLWSAWFPEETLRKEEKRGGIKIIEADAGSKKVQLQAMPHNALVKKVADSLRKKSGVKDEMEFDERVFRREAGVLSQPSQQAQLIPTSFDRRSRMPLSPTQVLEIVGEADLRMIDDIVFPDDDPMLLDVFKFLGAELEPAYDLVCQPQFVQGWWTTSQPRELASAIRHNDLTSVQLFRNAFYSLCDRHMKISGTTRTLAWAVAVESALLNERLNEDLREVAATKGCPCPPGEWLEFYGPNPPPEARQAFVDYVNCRWPVHVFAIDPVTQDENLGDVYSRRREMQFALSLAFVGGQISTSSFTRYARRLESDMATIALHRTAAGFVHGDKHFGWRFHPRFQTPPFEGNLTTIVRDQIMGGPSKEAELLEMAIEPGQRECVAVVIMPSIVSEIQLETSSRWFKLTNPKRDEPSVSRTVELSAAVQRMQTCAAQVVDGCDFRAGEVERLLNRVEQLGASLSLQTLRQQVPMENTLGGFAMFNSGQTDLAPQLHGYYGETCAAGRENVVYLVGDHFSVHETRVLAGNRDCAYKMLSRRVLQVTLPSNLNVVVKAEDGVEKKTIDVHVATPYGVTGHLEIIVGERPPAPRTDFAWVPPGGFSVGYSEVIDPTTKKVTSAKIESLVPASGELLIQAPENFAMPGTAAATVRLTITYEGEVVGAIDSITLGYEHLYNRLAARGTGLATALNSDAFKGKLASHLARIGYLDTALYEVRAHVTLNGVSVHEVVGTLSVILKKTKP